MLITPVSPRDISHVTDLQRRPAFTRGKGVTIVQIEHDIFPDHDSMSTVIQANNVTTASTLHRVFHSVKRTVHATAVGSIINDPEYGIAPDADYVFVGFSADSPDESGLIEALEGLRDGRLNLGDATLEGAFVNISMQLSVKNGREQCSVPVDSNRQIKKLINQISEKYNATFLIAAGNSAKKIDNIIVEHSIDDFASKDKPEGMTYGKLCNDSLALKVGYTDISRAGTEYSNWGESVTFSAPASSVRAACHAYDAVLQRGDLLDVHHNGFSKTSAATPIVAASLACIQSCLKDRGEKPLSRDEMIDLINATGTRPAIGEDRPIGVQPSVKNALRKLGILPDRAYHQKIQDDEQVS